MPDGGGCEVAMGADRRVTLIRLLKTKSKAERSMPNDFHKKKTKKTAVYHMML